MVPADPPDPRALFDRLLLAIGMGGPIPAEVREWFVQGGYRYSAGQEPTLCRALGLRPRGCPSVALAERREYRNLYLRSAYLGVAPPAGLLSDYARAARLAGMIQRFEMRQWPRLRRLDPDAVRAGLGWVDLCLFGAFGVGLAVPNSARAVWRIVRPQTRSSH
jgi:hypothetical protein